MKNKEVLAHPSAGQSDARIDRPSYKDSKDFLGVLSSDNRTPVQRKQDHELYDSLGKILSFGKSDAEIIAEITDLFNARLAESRAAMREEAAKVGDEWLKYPSCEEGTACTHQRMAAEISSRIRALPANSRALDARDARVSEEALKGLDDLIAKWRADVSDVTVDSGWMVGARPKTASMKAACADQLERFVLAQRSAEKGETMTGIYDWQDESSELSSEFIGSIPLERLTASELEKLKKAIEKLHALEKDAKMVDDILSRWIRDANEGRIKDGKRELSNNELAMIGNVLRCIAGDIEVRRSAEKGKGVGD